MFRRSISFLALFSCLLLAACGSRAPSPSPSGFKPVKGVSVSGEFGSVPSLKFDGSPSSTLDRTVLSEGSGPAVAEGKLVIVNYLGQLFDGDKVDSSFDSYPLSFTAGSNSVIKGWEKTLLGVKSGSRVLISVPPSEGFGSDAFVSQSQPADQVIVYVIDVIKVLPSDQNGSSQAALTGASFPGVSVSGALGSKAELKVDPSSAYPSKDQVLVLATGTGTPVVDGSVTVQYASSNWSGSLAEDTWSTLGVTSVPVGGTDSVLDQLAGVPVGSRVLVLFAPSADDPDPSSTATAVVMDIIDQAFVRSAK